MKPKKKSTQHKSTNVIKLLNVKTHDQQQKTREKTFATIQENLRTFENQQFLKQRNSFKRNSLSGKPSYTIRMEENNLSPFSNDGRSVSPKYVRTPQKLIKQQKSIKLLLNIKDQQKKKSTKSKVNSARQSKKAQKPQKLQKISKISQNEVKKKSNCKKSKAQKCQKQQKARIQFQNQFLNMMNQRIHDQKITQLSDQDLQGSIRRRKPIIFIQTQNSLNKNNYVNKDQIVKSMKIKVMNKIQKEYPNLQNHQKKIMCAVIIIQRLWRQRKVKQFFEHYVTPKSSPQTSFRQSLKRQICNNQCTMSIISNKFLKKQLNSNRPTKDQLVKQLEDNFLLRENSIQSLKTSQNIKCNKKEQNIVQQSLREFQNQNNKMANNKKQLDRPQMLKFLQCYREIRLNKKKRKQNVFSIKQSLSQKCLMQKYYSNIFYDKPQKDQLKNYQLFSFNKQTQKSIELLKEINQKNLQKQKIQQKQSHVRQYEEVWIRNQTHYSQETDSDQLSHGQAKLTGNMIVTDNIIVDQNQLFKKRKIQQQLVELTKLVELAKPPVPSHPDQQIPQVINPKSSLANQPSLKQLQVLSQDLISWLMREFCEQFSSFTEKKLLKKKHSQKQEKQKKSRLPGIHISQTSINQYYLILIDYVLKYNKMDILKSLNIFNPNSYMKTHRAQSVIHQVFQQNEDQSQDQDLYYWNVVSNQAFFDCQQIYQQKNLILSKQNQKFINFIQLTMKIHNRCLSAAFSQYLNKAILQQTSYPWNKLTFPKVPRQLMFDQDIPKLNNKAKVQSINKLSLRVKDKIISQSFLKIGSFRHKSTEEEEAQLLKIISNQYAQQGDQWLFTDQIYQLKCQITQFVFNLLLQEIQPQFNMFKQIELIKSENSIFLQTNQTLQTH